MKLLYSPGAFPMAPHIVAREAGIPVDLVRVDIPNKKTGDGGDFRQINPKLTPEMKEVQLATITRRLDSLEKMLAGKDFIAGDSFSAADAYLLTVLNWTSIHKIDLSTWPNIQACMGSVCARPGVQETLKAEGLVK